MNPETVSYLVDNTSEREVYLVGASHISESSADEVRKVLHSVEPDCVMVELCEQRAQRLRSGHHAGITKKFARDLMDGLLRRSSLPGFGVECLIKLGFAGFNALLRQYGLVPGLELKVALLEADRRGLPLCYGDADVDETISNLGAAIREMSFSRLSAAPPMPRQLEELVGTIDLWNLSRSIEMLKNRRHVAMFRDHMSLVMPELMDVLVHQRDSLMVDALLHDCRPGCIVAVVGMAHMDGIESEWQRRSGQVFLHAECSLRSKE